MWLLNNKTGSATEEVCMCQMPVTYSYYRQVFSFECSAFHFCKQISIIVAFVCIIVVFFCFAKKMLSVTVWQQIVVKFHMKLRKPAIET